MKHAPDRAAVEAAIDAAVMFLARRQRLHGEIAAYRYPNPALTGHRLFDSSPFTTTFVLHALDYVRHPRAGAMRQRAEAFLLAEQSPPGLWRYWTSRSGLPIDPDVDDTSCVSFALRNTHAGRASTGNNVAVILANRDAEGLFKTWIRDAAAPNDIDYVVNANVLLYLGERAETIAARDALAGVIHEDREDSASHYYLDPLALYYAVGRAREHGVSGLMACRDAVLRKIASRRVASGGIHGGALTTALGVCALASFHAFDEPGVGEDLRYLIDAQSADGGFARAAFYAGPEPPQPHSVYWGSEELTTALCLEALARYVRRY